MANENNKKEKDSKWDKIWNGVDKVITPVVKGLDKVDEWCKKEINKDE